MEKSDVIGWTLIIGGIGVLGFLGYRGIRSLFPGGNGGDIDFWGRETAQSQTERAHEAIIESSERDLDLARNQAINEASGAFEAHPEYERAYDAYIKEVTEYHEMVRGYSPEWTWTGAVSQETQDYYQRMLKEYAEAMAAYSYQEEMALKINARNMGAQN